MKQGVGREQLCLLRLRESQPAPIQQRTEFDLVHVHFSYALSFIAPAEPIPLRAPGDVQCPGALRLREAERSGCICKKWWIRRTGTRFGFSCLAHQAALRVIGTTYAALQQ